MATMTENGRPLDKETMMLIDKFESAIGESVKIDAVVKAAMVLIVKSLLIIHKQTNPAFTFERLDEVITNIKSNVLLNMAIRNSHEGHLN